MTTGAKCARLCRREQLFVHYVHSYFKTETHFGSSWFSPHSRFSFSLKFVLAVAITCDHIKTAAQACRD